MMSFPWVKSSRNFPLASEQNQNVPMEYKAQSDRASHYLRAHVLPKYALAISFVFLKHTKPVPT